MLYKIILEHSVKPADGQEQNWEVTIELPFVPWEGLDLVDVLDNDGVAYTVRRVYWYGSATAFVVQTEPAEHETWDAEECRKEFVSKGWTSL